METYSSLKKLFEPSSVAIVGASEDAMKLSGQPMRNLKKVGFKGSIFPVNPRVGSIDGVKCYKSLQDIQQPVDVAIICLPAELAVNTVEECLHLKIPTAIVAVSGFSEVNTEKGKFLQNKLSMLAKQGIRIVGPNCNGIYNVHDRISIGYNVTHGKVLKKGSIAVLSHSGALFSSIESLSATYGEGLGFSYFVSAGNEADLTLVDYLDYMIRDSRTQIITMILDGVHDAQKFRQLCKEARLKGKYLVALKIGNSEAGVQATLAHSSRLSGSGQSYAALLRECGVIQVDNIESLVGVCAIIEYYNLNGKSGIAGLSTSGAGCAVMADIAEQYSLHFPQFFQSTVDLISKKRGFGTPMNPFDVGASESISIGYISESMAQDDQIGYVLFNSTILQTKDKRSYVAQLYSDSCNSLNRFPLIVLAPGPLSPEEMQIYRENNIVVFNNTDTAFKSIKAIINSHDFISDRTGEIPIDEKLIETGNDDLTNLDISEILKELNIPQPRQIYVESPEEIQNACHQIGYPLVIKGISHANTHKSDVGLVWTDVINDADVDKIASSLQNFLSEGMDIDGILIQEFIKGEMEVMIGVNKDPDIGYVLVLGSGGKYTEIYEDIEICTIPASREEIQRILLKTKAGQILNNCRNNGLNPKQIVDIAYNTQRIIELEGIQSLDLNPIIVNVGKATAVDIRVV